LRVLNIHLNHGASLFLMPRRGSVNQLDSRQIICLATTRPDVNGNRAAFGVRRWEEELRSAEWGTLETEPKAPSKKSRRPPEHSFWHAVDERTRQWDERGRHRPLFSIKHPRINDHYFRRFAGQYLD